VCECNVVAAQTLSYHTQLATHRHPPPSPKNSDTCVHCRANIFGALQAVLIGFFQVKIDVGSTGISSHFLIEIECRAMERVLHLSKKPPSSSARQGPPC
jgi:hypothetical protein